MNREISKALAIVAKKYNKLSKLLGENNPSIKAIKEAKTEYFKALNVVFSLKELALSGKHRVGIGASFETSLELLGVIALQILNRREPPSDLEMKNLESSMKILDSYTQEQVNTAEELTRSIQKSMRNNMTL